MAAGLQQVFLHQHTQSLVCWYIHTHTHTSIHTHGVAKGPAVWLKLTLQSHMRALTWQPAQIWQCWEHPTHHLCRHHDLSTFYISVQTSKRSVCPGFWTFGAETAPISDLADCTSQAEKQSSRCTSLGTIWLSHLNMGCDNVLLEVWGAQRFGGCFEKPLLTAASRRGWGSGCKV